MYVLVLKLGGEVVRATPIRDYRSSTIPADVLEVAKRLVWTFEDLGPYRLEVWSKAPEENPPVPDHQVAGPPVWNVVDEITEFTGASEKKHRVSSEDLAESTEQEGDK